MSTVFEQLAERQKEFDAEKAAEQSIPEPGNPEPDSPEPGNPEPGSPEPGNPEPPTAPNQPLGDTQKPDASFKSDDITDEVRSHVQNSILSNIFGEDAKSIDDAKNHYSKLRSEVDAYKGKVSDFEKQLQEKNDPFANEKVKRYNQYAKKTGNDDFRVFNLIESMNEDQVQADPLGVAVTGRILENPTFAGKESIVREVILEELGLEADTDISELNDKQKLRLDAMAQRAVRSIKEQKDLIGKIEPSQTLEEIKSQRQAVQEESRTKWSPVIESVLPSIGTYVIGKGDTAFTFEFDKSKLSEYGKLATDYLAKNGKDFTQDSVKEAASMIRNGLIVENFDSIMKAHATYVHNLKQEEYDKLYSNPSALDPKVTDPKPNVQDPALPSSQNQLLEFQRKNKERVFNQ